MVSWPYGMPHQNGVDIALCEGLSLGGCSRWCTESAIVVFIWWAQLFARPASGLHPPVCTAWDSCREMKGDVVLYTADTIPSHRVGYRASPQTAKALML